MQTLLARLRSGHSKACVVPSDSALLVLGAADSPLTITDLTDFSDR